MLLVRMMVPPPVRVVVALAAGVRMAVPTEPSPRIVMVPWLVKVPAKEEEAPAGMARELDGVRVASCRRGPAQRAEPVMVTFCRVPLPVIWEPAVIVTGPPERMLLTRRMPSAATMTEPVELSRGLVRLSVPPVARIVPWLVMAA